MTEEIVQPAPFTTTIFSGSSSYTSTTVLTGGQTEVEIFGPATTTTTSYTATTTITTTTYAGANGQTTVEVIEPTPGMQFFGFVGNPSDYARQTKPDASQYNDDAAHIDVQGVFPGDINLFTDPNGGYTFPGQTSEKNISNYAVVFEGYFYGPAGTYNVELSQETDDYSFLFCSTTDSGFSAYSGWTDGTACITESISEGGGYTQNHTITLAEGEFAPLTIMWFNVYLAGGVRFWIYPPDGSLVNDTTGYFVQPYASDLFKYHV